MKKILTLTLLFIVARSFGQSDFSRISASTDSTYGYTDTNPLKMKKGNAGKSIGYSYDFLNSLKTHDGQKLRFLQRSSVDNPKYKGIPASDQSETLDKYLFLTSTKKDTVVIYVDLHNRGNLKIPVGLKHR